MSYFLKPSQKTNCFKCQKAIEVKWCPPKQNYSNKNHWAYWTDKEENQGQYICDKCLIYLYRNQKKVYLKAITNNKKRRILRTYIGGRVIHV